MNTESQQLHSIKFDTNGEWFSGRAPDGRYNLEVCPTVNGIMVETEIDNAEYRTLIYLTPEQAEKMSAMLSQFAVDARQFAASATEK